jgi:O-antigen/teichoic acid export membrane protein
VIYQRFSLVLLPTLAGSAATGWFSAGARLIEAAKIGQVAVFTALYPLMAQASRTQGANWSRSLRLPGLFLLGGALIAALGLYTLARPLVVLLYGAQYLSAIPVVRILAWILVPYALNNFLTLAFLARGQESVIGRALILSILSLALLTFRWAPSSGVLGAASAALCAEIVQSVALVVTDFRRVRVLYSMLQARSPL